MATEGDYMRIDPMMTNYIARPGFTKKREKDADLPRAPILDSEGHENGPPMSGGGQPPDGYGARYHIMPLNRVKRCFCDFSSRDRESQIQRQRLIGDSYPRSVDETMGKSDTHVFASKFTSGAPEQSDSYLYHQGYPYQGVAGSNSGGYYYNNNSGGYSSTWTQMDGADYYYDQEAERRYLEAVSDDDDDRRGQVPDEGDEVTVRSMANCWMSLKPDQKVDARNDRVPPKVYFVIPPTPGTNSGFRRSTNLCLECPRRQPAAVAFDWQQLVTLLSVFLFSLIMWQWSKLTNAANVVSDCP